MIHAAAPHFLWPFAVRMDVTFDESVPFYRLFPYRTAPLPPPPPAAHPRARSLSGRPTPLQGPAPSGVSQTDPLSLAKPVKVTSDSGAAGGGAARGAASGGAEPAGAGPGGAEPMVAEPGGAASEGAEPGGAEPEGAEPGGRSAGVVGPRAGGTGAIGAGAACAGAGAAKLESVEPEVAEPGGAADLASESLSRHGSCASGLLGAPAFGVALLELEALELEALAPGALELQERGLEVLELEALALEALELRALVLEALELTVLELEALELEALELEALELETLELEALELEALELEVLELEVLELEALELQALVLEALLLEVLELEVLELEALCSSDQRREPASRPASLVCTVRRAPRVLRPRSPPVLGTHTMALRPSFATQRVPLPSPPASSLPDVPDPESDHVRAASPTVIRLLATVVTDPSFESTDASTLVAELVDFAAACRLDYAASLVAESESVCPPSIGGECALGTDVLDDRQEDFECLAAAVPHLVAWLLAPEGDSDALDIPTPRSYAEAITGPYSSKC
ncbi:unnamed protein product [Closterium sp. Yama58-4]|nr:unnamed protein product [Closterium sp. Yama58-4]